MREGERKNTSRAALDALDAGVVVLDESGRVELSNRRANELRQERDRLLQLAAVGAALPSVLHELRSPLAAMTTLLEVMLDEPPGPLTSDLQLMLSEVRRLSLTLQGLGGIVRSAKAERSAAIDLAVRDACRILEPMASRKGVSLEAVGPALPTLPIDPEVLSGVIFNLVTNAIEACSDGGSVVVDCRLEGDSVFKLSVCDSGSGMSPESLARSTEMFFSTKNMGSGLGLTLCNRIAEVSNGRLEIDSALGQGTRITMHIPLNQPQNN